jgi:hypothetical protein
MRGAPRDRLEHPLHSVWSLLVPRLPPALYRKLEGWARDNKAIAENFANYIKAGFLYASPVVVELYAWFVEYRQQTREREVQRAYRGFHDWVSLRVDGSLMLRYFTAALKRLTRYAARSSTMAWINGTRVAQPQAPHQPMLVRQWRQQRRSSASHPRLQ